MFMLYGVIAGLLLGLALGGSPRGLELPFRWPWLAVAGLGVQLLLFSTPLTDVVGDAGPVVYVASTLAVLVVVLRNVPVAPGLLLVAAGALANLAAIVANGGYMPSLPGAAAAVGHADPSTYSNSVVIGEPALAVLVDRFAIPRGVPFANVFSIGDVLIALGVVLVIVIAMRRGRGGGQLPAREARA